MRLQAGMAIAVLLLVATGCGEDDDQPRQPSTTSTTSPDETPSDAEPTASESAAPLDWTPTGHDVDDRVIVGERWTAIATGSGVVFESATNSAGRFELPAVGSSSVGAVLLDGDTAVVSYAFGGETTAGLGHRIDLTTRKQTEIVSPEPANGGNWALVDDSLYYPALGEDGRLCLATLAVRDGNGEDGWCAPARSGFSNLIASPEGVGLVTFDDARPVACRTLHLLDATATPVPVEGPTECQGWDVAATATGVVWSEVPDERRQEIGRFEALAGDERKPLGRGTTGSLTSCGGDVFFGRDPSGPSEPARLMRWDGSALSVAWESASKGNVFLGDPECADDILTVAALGEDGDEQVWASVG